MPLPKTVTTITHKDTEYYLLGTAHVSKESVQDVIDVVNEVHPDSICIELCDARFES